MADSGRLEFDENLTGLWPIQVERHDFEGFTGSIGYCCACLHVELSPGLAT
jgi:hypothetical protein